jgi:hypothetical protein
MVIQDVGISLVLPLELAGCMIHFKHRLPTTEEINSLKQHCLTQGDTPWNPSSFSDQVADKFYHQVIDNEQNKSLNTKSDHSSDIKVDLVEQDIPKLSYFDPRSFFLISCFESLNIKDCPQPCYVLVEYLVWFCSFPDIPFVLQRA